MDSVFHLVLVAERMEESLILLKELLCWDLKDVVVFKHNPRSKEFYSPITNTSRDLIKRYNKVDVKLYKHFNAKFDRMIKAFGKERMAKEVSALRNLTNDLYRKCVSSEELMPELVPGKFYPNSKVLAFRQKDLSDSDLNSICDQLTLHEMVYTDRLRKRQQAKLLAKKLANDRINLVSYQLK